MKPILPHKVLINTKHSYQIFRKNQTKISLKLEINQDSHFPAQSRIPKLMKIFKTLKYSYNLDLSKLILFESNLYLPKMIYFAKRMSHADTIHLFDNNKFSDPQKRISESWPKYAKGIKTLSYDNIGTKKDMLEGVVPAHVSIFANFVLRYQPRIKNLSIHSLHDMSYFVQSYCNHRKSPPSLERLSLDNVTFHKLISPLNSNRLKNLKHFEIKKSTQMMTAENPIVSILNLLPGLCPNLLSLSLCWNYSPTPKILSLFPKIKAFQHLKTLKIEFGSMTTKNLKEIFRSMSQCSLTSLDLKLGIKEEAQLLQITQLIEKQDHLQNLKLQINCEKRFTAVEFIKLVFRTIDDLLNLRNLSISISSKVKKGLLFKELHPAFTKTFTKQIPLESFKLHIEHFSISNQEFLDLCKALEPVAPTLKKLKIDVGKTSLKKDERKGLLGFLKKLKNIRSLKLKGLILSSKLLLKNFANSICRLPSLRSLTLKEISSKVPKQLFLDYIREILMKRGLERFHSSVSYSLIPLLRPSFQLTTIRNIRKLNPSLAQVKFGLLDIFNAYDEYKISFW